MEVKKDILSFRFRYPFWLSANFPALILEHDLGPAFFFNEASAIFAIIT